MDDLTFREAAEADLPFIVALMDDDAIAAARDPALPAHAGEQREAFAAIAADPNHTLYVAELGGEPVGSFQLSFLPGVSRQGAWRGQIESVRVRSDLRGKGIGAAMIRWAIDQSRERGCGLVQLTSDARRTDAHRFYERLGFKPSHQGFKLKFPRD